ncbi:protein Red-like [Dipodomys merriami]|uniref:protein Red-like n=1 Tax=Dipodomys merriami TaxID=94247 RepID=UPI003855EEEB
MEKQDFKLFPDSWALRGQHGDGPFSFLKSKLTNDDLRRLRGISPCKSHYPEISEECEEDKELAPLRWKKSSTRYYYQGLERGKEPGEKYGDYAKEWRERMRRKYEESQPICTTGIYRRAMSATLGVTKLNTEKQKQFIQGGDLEHTHLGKGKDVALLQRIRSETTNKERRLMEKAQSTSDNNEEPELQTPLGRTIYQALFQKNKPDAEPNKLFLPGRMAYLVNLNDDAESDIPLTVIRDKADCPSVEPQTFVNTSDTIISKLTQVFSHLGQDTYSKKYRKKDQGEKRPFEASSTFYNIEDRMTPIPKTSWDKMMARSREHLAERNKELNREWLRDQAFKTAKRRRFRSLEKSRIALQKELESTTKLMKSMNIQSSHLEGTESLKKLDLKKHLGDHYTTANSYMECYPTTVSDTLENSYKEKMEFLENKRSYSKDLLHRRDFETQAEYKEYLRNKICSRNVIAMLEGWKTWRFREDYDKAKRHRQRKKKEGSNPEVKRLKYPSPVAADEYSHGLLSEIPNKDTRYPV